jgi:conjugation system ATPase, TraG family
MSWFLLNRNLTLLEPYDWKLSRTVLRGERGSNASDLPGKAIAKEGMADYIRYLFKTVRKFYGEAVVVTQEVDDIISSPIVKESIVNNSDCKILLDQRKYLNKFSQIQSLLGLTDKEKAQILSVNMSNDPRRKYKEVWFGLGGVQSTVYATEVSLEEYLCYSTEESEKVELEGLTKELGGNIKLAIRRLAEKKRNQNNEIP